MFISVVYPILIPGESFMRASVTSIRQSPVNVKALPHLTVTVVVNVFQTLFRVHVGM